MQSRGLEIVVGFFVCLGIAAVFLLTLRVSNLADVSAGSSYQVTAEFSNIGGLREGGKVTLAGVRVGRIASIELDQGTYEAVVAMNIDSDYRIPEDSDASILTAGLLGEQYIGIGPGASDKPLKNGDEFLITQSAVILENLIGQVLYAVGGSGEEDQSGGEDDGFGSGFGDAALPDTGSEKPSMQDKTRGTEQKTPDEEAAPKPDEADTAGDEPIVTPEDQNKPAKSAESEQPVPDTEAADAGPEPITAPVPEADEDSANDKTQSVEQNPDSENSEQKKE